MIGLSKTAISRVVFAAGLFLWFCLRWHFRTGYYFEDSPGYVSDAIALLEGSWRPRNFVNGMNIGTYFPVALFIRLLGKHETAVMIWPLLCSLVSLLSWRGVVLQLMGAFEANLFMILYALYPGDVVFSTVVMPDVPVSAFFALSVFFAVRAAKDKTPARWSWVISGICLGLGYWTRVSAVFLAPAVLAAVFFDGKERKIQSVFAFMIGFGIPLLAEMFVYRYTTGQFLHRFYAIHQEYGTASALQAHGLNIQSDYIFQVMMPLYSWIFQSSPLGILSDDQSFHALIFCLALISIAIGINALFDRVYKRVYLFACWVLLWPILYHQFGTESLAHYIPLHRLSRHFIVYAAPAGLMFCFALFFLRRKKRWVLFACALSLFLYHAMICLQSMKRVHERNWTVKKVQYALATQLQNYRGVVFEDPGTSGFLDFVLNPLNASSRVRFFDLFNVLKCSEFLPGSAVVIESEFGWWNGVNERVEALKKRLPCLEHPPAYWKAVPTLSRARLFYVNPSPTYFSEKSNGEGSELLLRHSDHLQSH